MAKKIIAVVNSMLLGALILLSVGLIPLPAWSQVVKCNDGSNPRFCEAFSDSRRKQSARPRSDGFGF
jgi:hypothetical protein